MIQCKRFQKVNSAGTVWPCPWLQQPLWDPSTQGCPIAAVPLLHPLNSSTTYQETFQHQQRLYSYSNLRPTDISFMAVLMHQPNSLYSLESKYRTWQTTAPATALTTCYDSKYNKATSGTAVKMQNSLCLWQGAGSTLTMLLAYNAFSSQG